MLRGVVPILSLLLAGCAGPIIANSAIFRAQGAMHEAEASGAQEKALYQYTLGTYLLQKAWEEQAHSSYQTSEEMAEQAERAFREAMRQSTTLGSGNEELPDSQPAGGQPSKSTGGDNWGQDGD